MFLSVVTVHSAYLSILPDAIMHGDVRQHIIMASWRQFAFTIQYCFETNYLL